jgi:hypothetical protein
MYNVIGAIVEPTHGHLSMDQPPKRLPTRSLVVWVFIAFFALTSVSNAAERKPSPKLTPEDVIRLQINALSAEGPIKTRIQRCYEFASPANRLNTGPVKRFGEMIRQPKYAVLLDAKHFLVGRASVNGRQAHLLLTVVDSQGNLCLFRCLLSKQTRATYIDCWMTDAVVRIGDVDSGKTPNQPLASSSPTI